MKSLFTRKPISACIYTMFGLPARAWERFGIWLLIGIALYIAYGHRHSTLRSKGQ